MKSIHTTRCPLHCLATWFAVTLATLLTPSATAQVHELKEMNTEQIRALPRDQTVVLRPGGIREQHGPYLPSYTDGYMNEHLTAELAKAIAKRPGWQVVIFPVIPLGEGAANVLGDKHVFPGTYDIRASTLRAVFMDLADDLGQQQFRCTSLGSPEQLTGEDGLAGCSGGFYAAACLFRLSLPPPTPPAPTHRPPHASGRPSQSSRTGVGRPERIVAGTC